MRTETFDELSQRLAADPPSHSSNSGSWNLQAHRRWERLQAETAVKWLLAHAAPGPNRDDVEQVVVRLGRGWGPYVLDVLQTAGALTADTATLAGPIWGMAEYPEGRGGMTRASWLSVFAVTGYTVDGMRAERPGSPVRLYRGAPPSRRSRMAWTDDLATAERFARGELRGREAGQVWTADVAPERLLARIHEGGRSESEYVIITRGLRVVALG
jgi:hypothetical protein